MQVIARMENDYKIIVFLDNEAVKLLHQLTKVKKEKDTDVIECLILGGLVLMQTVNKQGEYERNKKCKGGRISLLFKHLLHLK